MKEKFLKFMEGRYGVDSFAQFTMAAALICIVVSLFFPGRSVIGAVLNTVGIAAIIYTYFRMLSRNIQKRYAENERYLSRTAGIRQWLKKEKNIMRQRKTHHIYSCPSCGQKIRIPRGKGRIEIDCPKCHTKFIKNS
ncbi:MAG TPA: hypothetical protein IAA26_00645 [Candidatus Blautia faecipullorum]|nr:hypothetical protein [Candidatus Blautia faecipullorum]